MPYVFNPFTSNFDLVQDLSGYLPLTGGTMTGAITMSGANIVMGGNDITGLDDITFNADAGSVFGSSTVGMSQIHFAQAGAGSTYSTDFRGILMLDALGDTYFGSPPSFGNYYVQTTVKSGSSGASADQATSVWQGNWGGSGDATPIYPLLELNWNNGNGTFSGYNATLRNSAVTIGAYIAATTLGGGGLLIAGRATNTNTWLYYDEANKRFKIEGVAQAMAANQTTSIGVGGTQVVDFVPLTTDVISLGTSTLEWEDGSFSKDVRMRSIVLDGDAGSGIASTVLHTNLVTAVGGATGTAALGLVGNANTPTATAQSGWLKFYDGTTVKYLPVWT